MKYPGKQFKKLCRATDGLGLLPGGAPYGRCTLLLGHPGQWHLEIRGGKCRANWRGPAPGETCGICGKDGREH